MKPLTAHCRSCGADFDLDAVATAGTGTCPSCGIALSEDWTVLLVEECEAIEQLSQALVRSLRRLCGLPGHLEVHPEELLSNIASEVPWREHIDTEPGLVAAEIERLTQALDAELDPPSFAHDLRPLAARLLRLATVLDANQEATAPASTSAGGAVRHAANRVEETADAIERGDANADAIRRTLTEAARTT